MGRGKYEWNFLSESEIPELGAINKDIQFEGAGIRKDEFNMIWEKATKRNKN